MGKRVGMAVLVGLTGLATIGMAAAPAIGRHAMLKAPQMTGAQILSRTWKAYDSVRSLEQEMLGSVGTAEGTAHIYFQRPGKLRVTGLSMFHAPYDLLVVGRTCEVFNGGSWTKSESPEMGIATITGISGSAGSYVPAALLDISWGSLKGVGSSKLTVALDSLAGRKAYKIKSQDSLSTTIWVDAKTFMMLKVTRVIMGRVATVVGKPPIINGPIPGSRFVVK